MDGGDRQSQLGGLGRKMGVWDLPDLYRETLLYKKGYKNVQMIFI